MKENSDKNAKKENQQGQVPPITLGGSVAGPDRYSCIANLIKLKATLEKQSPNKKRLKQYKINLTALS